MPLPLQPLLPSLPALHDSNFAARASSRPAPLFSLGAALGIPLRAMPPAPGWVPGSRETGSRPRRRTTAGCHHLASTCGPAPKALIVTEGRNHGRGGEQSTHSSGCSLPRHPWDAAQGWCGAHCQAHPASCGQVAPALPAPAPAGAALWQLQLSEAVSTSSAPSTCQPRRLQGHLGPGTHSPCQRSDGHPSYQGVHPPPSRLHISLLPDAGGVKHRRYAASPCTDANSALFQS